MLQIPANFTSISVGAGEPMVWEFQPASSAGVPDSLQSRAFGFVIYDTTTGVEHLYSDGTNILDTVDPRVFFAFDGTVTRALAGKSNLRFNFAERDKDGFELIAEGPVTITPTAPTWTNFGSSQIARYVIRIQRRNDPDTLVQPVFKMTRSLYQAANVIPPVGAPSLNFSLATNSGYLGFI